MLVSLAWHFLNDYETNVDTFVTECTQQLHERIITFVSSLLFTSTFKMLLSLLNYIIGML